MLTVVNPDGSTKDDSLLDEIVREGARRMLAAALEAEVNSYIAELAHERTRRGGAWWSATATTSRGRSPPPPA